MAKCCFIWKLHIFLAKSILMICATKIKKKTKTEVIGCSNDCYLNSNDNTKMCKKTKDLNCTLVI